MLKHRSEGRREPLFALCSMVLALSGALLAGCVVGPDYSIPPAEIPARWGNMTATRAPQATLAQWWRRLNDALLSGLIENGVTGNLDVASARARIREARATRRQAIGTLFPEITGSGSVTRNKLASSQATTGDSSIYNQYQAGFDASWELDLFGANRRSVEAATYGVDAAEDDLRSALLTMIGDVASYYIDARGYQARVELARRTAASQRETAALTKRKLDAGSASAGDVASATAQAASTEANIPTYQAAYLQSVHRVGVLLGRPPSDMLQPFRRSRPIPAPHSPLPTGIPADLLTMRPDIRKAERQLAQYTAKIGQQEAARYPAVSLTGSLSTTAYKAGDFGKSSTIGWSIGPSLSVPIFNGGQLRAAVQIAESQRDQYFVAWRSAVLSGLEDVENAIVNFSQERIKLQKLNEAVRNYREAVRLQRSLYETGLSSFLEVLDAERSLYSAEDSLLQSRVAVAKYYIALAKALGGGWDGTVDSSMPEVIDINTGPHIAPRPWSVGHTQSQRLEQHAPAQPF